MAMVTRIIAAGAILGATTSIGWAADHRESPRVTEVPPADLNDLYVFRSLERNQNLVLVMTVNPVSDPNFATTYAFSPFYVYRFTIDTDGDAVPESEISITFSPLANGQQTATITLPDGSVLEGNTTPPTVQPDGPNPPVVISDPEIPNVRAFAGPRDDPFFFDGVGFSRVLAGGEFTNQDSFAALNVSAIVLELPISTINDGCRQLQFSAFTNRRPDDASLGLIFDRTGNPAVSTALIPIDLRQSFNRGLPENDAEDFGPVILESLEAFGTSEENIQILASVAIPDTMKVDLDQPIGFPNGRDLDDDVIDTLLALILNNPDATDGVDSNDAEFLDEFPYLAPPLQAR